jgi:glyoxylase-like metal-dependent hydrolase (beta-lactamase superfamily II)
MAHVILQVGHVGVTAFVDVDVPIGPIVESFPDVPADALLAERERYPGVYGPGYSWRLFVRAWLVRHPHGLLLMDTGVGGPSSPAQAWCPTTGQLAAALDQAHVDVARIDTVAISHLHDDHIGGLLREDGSPVFPNARHVIQTADIEWLGEQARTSEEDAKVFALLGPLEEAGLIDRVEGDTRLHDELELHHLPGHTPGHQVLRVSAKGHRLVISADTFNHPSQLSHPDWPSGLDTVHAQAAASRRRLLAELLSNPGTVIAPTHFAEAFGKVTTGPDGLAAWAPVA